MVRKIFIFACFFALSNAASGFCQDTKVEFEGRYWVSDMSADVKIIESNIGEKFDVKDDLGIEDENLPEGRLSYHTGPNSLLRLGYTQVQYSADEVVSRTIDFKGQSYTAGTRVESEFDIKYVRLGWLWYFLNLADQKLRLGSVLEAKGIMADVSLKAVTLSLSDSRQLIGGLPTAGLALEVNPIEKLSVFGEVSGIAAGEFGYFFDAEAGLRFTPFKNLSINAGYRMIDLKAENDPDFAKVQLKGPFASVTLKF
jgi:hypothetical protein